MTVDQALARIMELLGWNETQADAVFFCMTSDFSVLEAAVKSVLGGEIR